MNKSENYASDSDESDEDFCPDKELAAGNSASEEDSEGDSEEVEEENTKLQNKASRRSRKKTKKYKKHRKDEEDEDDKEYVECENQLQHKRTTRQTKNNEFERPVREQDNLELDEEEKTRNDSLWAEFMSTVKPVDQNRKIKDEVNVTPNGHKIEKTKNDIIPETTTSNGAAKKVTVTDIFNFAGEEVRVEKTVSIDNIKENKETTSSSYARKPSGVAGTLKRPSGSGGSGLGSVLNQIGKKKKMSVLEKSQLDWNGFKKDAGIEEDIQTHNKGRDGYLERQDFLQRTDLRQFEIEKNLRQSRRPY